MREVTFPCPSCEKELRLPESERFTRCPACQTPLNVPAQLAYLRGLEAFEEGQEVMGLGNHPIRRPNPDSPQDRQAMVLFREAYSSLQVAFEGELYEDQRQLGIEMMASMAQEFARRWMVSDFEGKYWSTAMAELTSQREYDAIQVKRQSAGSRASLLQRWYWRVRQNQLRSVLKELNRKLTLLEQQIDFVDLPKARNRNWKP